MTLLLPFRISGMNGNLLIKTHTNGCFPRSRVNTFEPELANNGRNRSGNRFGRCQNGDRNGHSAQRTAARDRGVSEPPAQRVDRSLRRRPPRRGRVGQITLIGAPNQGPTGSRRSRSDGTEVPVASLTSNARARSNSRSGSTVGLDNRAARVREAKREVFSFRTTPPAAKSCSFSRRASFSHRRQSGRSSSATVDRS